MHAQLSVSHQSQHWRWWSSATSCLESLGQSQATASPWQWSPCLFYLQIEASHQTLGWEKSFDTILTSRTFERFKCCKVIIITTERMFHGVTEAVDGCFYRSAGKVLSGRWCVKSRLQGQSVSLVRLKNDTIWPSSSSAFGTWHQLHCSKCNTNKSDLVKYVFAMES